ASKVSAHFVVARDGSVTQLAPCNVQTWHAGKSSWRGRSNVNSFAVGIEIANPGPLHKVASGGWSNDRDPDEEVAAGADVERVVTKEHGDAYWLGYTPEQIATVTDLCRALRDAYPTIGFIAPHWEIAPGRKVDTNPRFPLSRLRNSIFGVFAGIDRVAEGDIKDVQRRLKELGYHQVGEIDGIYGKATRGALLAFQADNHVSTTGIIDDATLKALRAAKPRAVSPARLISAEAAVADRPAVRTSVAAGRVVKASLLGSGILGSLSESGVLEKIEGASDIGRRVGAVVADWWPLVQPWWPLALIAAGGLLIWYLRAIRRAEVTAYERGEISP
ncbi:peptidoglycan recognition protein family protein, partial [Starkeya nomas]|uniref:peptidoglycan recognition protein family protein n=1 Tax=Starkeya nomas TaxID=2666134 RepID=UPI00190F9CAD